jgi:hypothetical protein
MRIYIILIIIITIIQIIKLKNYKNKFSNKLEFIHIPKTAGTSVEDFGLENNIKWGRYNKKYLNENYKLCSNWHSPNFKYKKNNFTIIRNPYDRIISEYFYRKTKVPFINWLNNIIKKFKVNKYVFDCHLLPQSEYVYDKNGNKKIEHIIYMDQNMLNNLDILFKKYNLNLDIKKFPKKNVSNKIFSKYELDQKTLDKIYNFYKIDFDNFGFKRLILNL